LLPDLFWRGTFYGSSSEEEKYPVGTVPKTKKSLQSVKESQPSLPAPLVPGDTEAERFDNAAHNIDAATCISQTLRGVPLCKERKQVILSCSREALIGPGIS
jgi:hypothetical protein